MMKKQSGFTLVEIMVATGMLGLLSLGTAKMMTNSNRSMKGIELRNEKFNAMTRITSVLNNQLSCRISLTTDASNPKLYGAATADITEAGGVQTISAIHYCANPVLVDVNPANDPIATEPPILESDCAAADTRTLYSDNDKIARDNTQLKIEYVPGASSTEAKIKVTFTKVDTGKLSTGASVKVEEVDLLVNYTGGVLTSCFSQESNSINTSISRSCRGNNARLVGDPASTTNPLRCEHDVDVTTLCASDEFFNGYAVTDASVPADANKLVPFCTPITDKKITGCSDGEYIVQSFGSLACETIPTCTGHTHLVADPVTKKLGCEDVASGCSAGKVLVSDGTKFICQSVSCNNSKVAGLAGQEYFVGFDSSGSPICNPVVEDSIDFCPNGGSLKMDASGAVKYECCTQDCSDSGSYCNGASYNEANGCGYCVGTFESTWPAGKDTAQWNEATQCGSGVITRVCNDDPPGPAVSSCGGCEYHKPAGYSGNTNTQLYCATRKQKYYNSPSPNSDYNTSWYLPSDFKDGSMKIWMLGGGGGGGGGVDQEGGGGGKAGSLLTNIPLSAAPSTNCTIQIGRAGARSRESGGGAGGSTMIDCGGVTKSVTGGAGGRRQGAGGRSGRSGESLGSVNNSGGYYTTTTIFSGSGGAGAGDRRETGRSATGNGSGGGGGGGGDHNGGAGSAGKMYIQWLEY